MWDGSGIGRLMGRRRSTYETLTLEELQSQGGQPIRGTTTCRKFVFALLAGLCLVALYTASRTFSTPSRSESNVKLGLSFGNGVSNGDLDSNSSFDSSQTDMLDEVEILMNGSSSETQEFCYLFDEHTGKNNGIENKLWYFRENYFFNSHHYFWHMYYTGNSTFEVARGGELFYFMHHEFLARYFNERWTAGLSIPLPFFFHNVTVVPEGFDPHLTAHVVGLVPPPRPPNQYLQDISPTTCNVFPVSLERVVQSEKSLNEAIQLGYVTTRNGSKLDLTGLNGVNAFGKILYKRYGDSVYFDGVYYLHSRLAFHGQAHILIAGVMDPTGAKHLCLGVMNANSVPLFDPVFFRFHIMLEGMFQGIKEWLEPYSPLGSDFPLLWPGVKVLGVEVKENHNDQPPNQLHTHWTTKTFNARLGVDWQKTDSNHTPICQKQLTYEQFHYKIIYENLAAESRAATVRIFLAPRFNEHGNRIPIKEQYKLFFTLDRFTTMLKPGRSEIRRLSQNSSLTLPESTWLEIKSNAFDKSFCGCGFPQNLLLPKGTREGKVYDLFVMLTDGVADAVRNENESKAEACQPAPVWCVNYGMKYNDAKPMGYPFDRRPYDVHRGHPTRPLAYLEDYMEGIGNMHATQITIRHLD